MNRIISAIFTIVISTALYADSDNSIYGGFGGPVIKTSHFSNSNKATLIGLKGAFLITPNFYMGAAGYLLASVERYSSNDQYNNADTYFGYAGFLTGYISPINKNIQWNTDILLGASRTVLYDSPDNNSFVYSDSVFSFTSELETSLLFDINDFFKIETGISYRYVRENSYYSSSDLSGYSIYIGFLFGDY